MCADSAVGALGVQNGSSAVARQQLPTMASTVADLFQEQGVRGFFKGVSMNWLKGPLAFGISFTIFDTVQGWIESDAERARRLPDRILKDK